MKISIIGSGNIGNALSTNFVKNGHIVYVANSRGPESLTDFAKETGAIPASIQEAVNNGDVVIIAIPEKNVPELPPNLFQHVPKNVAIVDAGNYYPTIRDGIIPKIEQGLMESEWVQQHIGKPVIKAFNSMTAASLKNAGKVKGDNNRIALPVSGDDDSLKATIMQLIEELGFDPFDQGKLKDSWRQQPGTIVYCTDLRLDQLTESLKAMGDIVTPEILEKNAITRDAIVEAYLKSLQS